MNTDDEEDCFEEGFGVGIVVCPEHGHGFMYNCPHLVVAVVTKSPLPGVEYREYGSDEDPTFRIGCWFCPACLETHHLPPSGSMAFDADGFPPSAASLCQPMCPGCFQEWRAAGHG